MQQLSNGNISDRIRCVCLNDLNGLLKDVLFCCFQFKLYKLKFTHSNTKHTVGALQASPHLTRAVFARLELTSLYQVCNDSSCTDEFTTCQDMMTPYRESSGYDDSL